MKAAGKIHSISFNQNLEKLINSQRRFNTTAYRYSNELFILFITLFLVFLVIVVTAAATVCMSVVFVLGMVVMSYLFTRSHHKTLLAQAHLITPQLSPRLAPLVKESATRLQVRNVETFVASSRSLNAYTFGLTSPKVIVLHSALLEVMDSDEMRFIIGHEMGHVRLGHTWLNSLVGGMAGIPSPALAFVILSLAFRWWNRACEYSADRAGLLACGNLNKAISALVKLAARGNVQSQAEMRQALQRLDQEDDDLANNLTELLATHPMGIKRIEQLQRYAKSTQYRRIQSLVDGNLKSAEPS